MPAAKKQGTTAKRSGKEFQKLATVLASQGGPRGVAPTRLVAEPAFLAEVKPLFWRNQEREAPAYERIMYNLDERNPSAEQMEMALTFRNVGDVPALGKRDNEDKVRRVLRTIRYPDVEPLLELAGIEGLTLPKLTTILHFYHPSYPIMSKGLVKGLNAIGYPVEFLEDVSEDSLGDYEGVMATLDRLKDRITFENVPESNCFLTRVLEGALLEAARSTNGGAKPMRKKAAANKSAARKAAKKPTARKPAAKAAAKTPAKKAAKKSAKSVASSRGKKKTTRRR